MKRREWIKFSIGASALAALGGWSEATCRWQVVSVAQASTFFAPHVLDRLAGGTPLGCRALGKRTGVWLDHLLLGYLPAEFAGREIVFVRCARIERGERGRLRLYVEVGAA